MTQHLPQVRLDRHGRYRDARGRWAKKTAPPPPADEEQSLAAAARLAAQQQLLAVVQELGHPAATPAQAWGVLLAAQAQMALDPGQGAQAIAAARLVALATGVLDKEPPPQEGLQLHIGAEAARQLLQLIGEVLAERGR